MTQHKSERCQEIMRNTIALFLTHFVGKKVYIFINTALMCISNARSNIARGFLLYKINILKHSALYVLFYQR